MPRCIGAWAFAPKYLCIGMPGAEGDAEAAAAAAAKAKGKAVVADAEPAARVAGTGDEDEEEDEEEEFQVPAPVFQSTVCRWHLTHRTLLEFCAHGR